MYIPQNEHVHNTMEDVSTYVLKHQLVQLVLAVMAFTYCMINIALFQTLAVLQVHMFS